MTLSTPSILGTCVAAAIASLLAQTILTGTVLAGATVVADALEIQGYEGPAQRIAFDKRGDAWLASSRALYRVHKEKAQLIVSASTAGEELALAPGGGVYARLRHDTRPGALFTVKLMKFSKNKGIELKMKESPFRAGTLYLGGAARLIVTATPMANLEGLSGAFLYVFWSSAGKVLGQATIEGPRIGVVDVTGDALLLLGESNAIAFRRDGRKLWTLDGNYRNGAISAKGAVALLNPASKNAIDEVQVLRDRKVTTVKMSSPVYDMALTADGSEGVVGVRTGELFFVAHPSCKLKPCQLQKISKVLVDGHYLISSIQFVDSKTIAIGAIQRADTTPVTYPAGAVLAVTTADQILINHSITLDKPTTWTPSIDVTYGARAFAAHTPQRAVVIRLGRNEGL